MKTRQPSQIKKDEQLGESFSTATNRLRKHVMFSLVVRLNENVCFRCGEIIESSDDFSLEHKRPWLDDDPSLFWDMDNIAFSHLGCNARDARPNRRRDVLPPHTVSRPEGMSWCSKCKTMRPINEFHHDKYGPNGRTRHCKECRSIARRH